VEVDRDLPPGGMDAAVDDPILFCATCGRQLDGDPADESTDDPTGDADRPMCGNCVRERDFLEIDMLDGVLDGHLDLDREWD
jgi:hypothetical protein